MNQQGLIPIIFLISLLVISSVGVAGTLYLNKTIPDFTSGNKDQEFTFSPNPSATFSESNSQGASQHVSAFQILLNRFKNNKTSSSSSPSVYPSPTLKASTSLQTTSSVTVTPTPTPTTSTVTSSNPYDLTSVTGSVKVMVKPQGGSLAYTPQAELAAVSGFKVLDGRSTDKITQFGKDRTDELRGEIIFSTAPPGPYKIRISYNGSWSDQKDVAVSSAQQTYVEFTVAGVTPTPTPTPSPSPSYSTVKPTLTVQGPYTTGDSGPCFDLIAQHLYCYVLAADYKFDEQETSYRYTSIPNNNCAGYKATVCWVKDTSKTGNQYVFKAKAYTDSTAEKIYSDEVSLTYIHP